jgi:hypothetical protein
LIMLELLFDLMLAQTALKQISKGFLVSRIL